MTSQKDLGKDELCQQFISGENNMSQETQQNSPNLCSNQLKPGAF